MIVALLASLLFVGNPPAASGPAADGRPARSRVVAAGRYLAKTMWEQQQAVIRKVKGRKDYAATVIIEVVTLDVLDSLSPGPGVSVPAIQTWRVGLDGHIEIVEGPQCSGRCQYVWAAFQGNKLQLRFGYSNGGAVRVDGSAFVETHDAKGHISFDACCENYINTDF